jgi:hypothetical protein
MRYSTTHTLNNEFGKTIQPGTIDRGFPVYSHWYAARSRDSSPLLVTSFECYSWRTVLHSPRCSPVLHLPQQAQLNRHHAANRRYRQERAPLVTADMKRLHKPLGELQFSEYSPGSSLCAADTLHPLQICVRRGGGDSPFMEREGL